AGWGGKSRLALPKGEGPPGALWTGGDGGPPPRHFKESCRAHPAADAHRHDDLLRAAALPLDERVPDEPRSAHAIRMADGNRAAVDVQTIVRDAEPIAAVDHLDGKRFIQLPQVHALEPRAGLLQQLRHGEHRADPHLVRLAAGDGEPAEHAERLHALPRGHAVAHDDGDAGAVRELAGVARGDDASLNRRLDLR